MTLGGAAQLVAAHCLSERTLDLQSAAITDAPASRTVAFTICPDIAK